MWIPRAATSVATRALDLPRRNSSSERSRCAWLLLPWIIDDPYFFQRTYVFVFHHIHYFNWRIYLSSMFECIPFTINYICPWMVRVLFKMHTEMLNDSRWFKIFCGICRTTIIQIYCVIVGAYFMKWMWRRVQFANFTQFHYLKHMRIKNRYFVRTKPIIRPLLMLCLQTNIVCWHFYQNML